jgi:hypothetical protein
MAQDDYLMLVLRCRLHHIGATESYANVSQPVDGVVLQLHSHTHQRVHCLVGGVNRPCTADVCRAWEGERWMHSACNHVPRPTGAAAVGSKGGSAQISPVPVPVEMRRMPSGPFILTVAVFRPRVPHVTCEPHSW